MKDERALPISRREIEIEERQPKFLGGLRKHAIRFEDRLARSAE